VRFSGPALRQVRERAGVKVPALAHNVERSTEAIRSYEADRATPPANVLGAMAACLGCSVDEFFVEDPELLVGSQ